MNTITTNSISIQGVNIYAKAKRCFDTICVDFFIHEDYDLDLDQDIHETNCKINIKKRLISFKKGSLSLLNSIELVGNKRALFNDVKQDSVVSLSISDDDINKINELFNHAIEDFNEVFNTSLPADKFSFSI